MWKQKEKMIILYFPTAGNVQPLSGKQGLYMHSGCFRRPMVS